MNPFKMSGLVAMALAFSACGPESRESSPGAGGTAQLESKVTTPIAGTKFVLESTEPSKFGPDGNGVWKIDAQASIWDTTSSGQAYPVIYTCSILEQKAANGTWSAVAGTRRCYGDTNSTIGGETSSPITYAAGTYRQRAQGAIKLNATTWSPAQSSSCSTLSSNVPCTLKEVLSNAVSL